MRNGAYLMSSGRARILLVSMLAVFAVGALASASASASFNLLWEVCEKGATGTKYTEHKCTTASKEGEWGWKSLAAGETRAVISSGGAFVLTAGGKKVECTLVTDKGMILGGKPGKDQAEEIVFTGCTANSKKCTAESGAEKGTIIVTNIPTELVEIGGKLADEFKAKENAKKEKEFVTLKFEEGTKECPNFPETKVKGDVAAEVGPGVGELNFPSTPLTVPVHLEAFGVSATLVGKDTQEVVVGKEKFGEGWAVRAS
jgi:hypothetical protein